MGLHIRMIKDSVTSNILFGNIARFIEMTYREFRPFNSIEERKKINP